MKKLSSLFVVLVFFVAALGSTQAVAQESSTVFLGVEEAVRLMEEGAVIVDARERSDYEKARIPGASHLPWQAFVEGEVSGEITASDEGHQARLRAAGISADRAVIIYANWSAASGWGEEGRVFWTLDYLGHPRVFVLAGGIQAWRAAGQPITDEAVKPSPKPTGDFSVERNSDLRISTADLHRALNSDQPPILLDTRERAEYDGEIKYGESRSGHIPGARHLHWRDLFDADQELRSAADLRRIFQSHGLSPDIPVVAYCTGGIRSGFVYAVLRHLGFTRVQNYDASMWDWTRNADLPLE